MCVASAEIRKDPHALATYMQAAQVSITYFTPTQFALLIENAGDILQNMRNYRIAYFAGEKLPVRVAKAFYDLGTPARLYNTWSPSELVVQTTIQYVEYPEDDTVNIPIGFPMANTRHYILDANANPLPAGVVGEIVVGGAQVGLGYIGRPDINERAFLPDPFCRQEDHEHGWGRMFRTGDRGRFLPDGRLEFHGRIAGDKQVKLRGYRVDLGEVEQRIFVEANKDDTDKGIQLALVDLAVVARPVTAEHELDTTDDRQLIAFVVPRTPPSQREQAAFAFRLNQMASRYLNGYMLPSAYQFVEKLPTTIGGKVDMQRLLKCPLTPVFPVEEKVISKTITAEQSDDANDAVLKVVIQGFRQILKLPPTRPVGPDDSFFALGGHSLLLMRLQARLKRALKRPLALNPMFKSPTPAGITHLIVGGSSSATVEPQPDTVSIDWAAETALDSAFKPSSVNIKPSQVNSVLLTGVDSFIGVHMLATLLEDTSIDNIYILGTQRLLEMADVYKSLDHYRLSDLLPPHEDLGLRIHIVPGTLVSPQFGLSAAAFRQLARNIQSIYHLGGYVSLLRPYDNALRSANVAPVHDIIHLASLGRTNTHIHHLSTWSVPHLQTWSTTTTTGAAITANETSAAHYTPEPSDRLGYFKSRWAAEILMGHAADRGFAVSIYRASAATGDSRTAVPEPSDDFIRTMIISMLRAGAIPQLPSADRPFVVDFVPVDYITSGIHALAMRPGNVDADADARSGAIYHLSNPSPLPITQLPVVTEELFGQKGRSLPVDEWFEEVARLDTAPESQVRWAVLKEYFDLGHSMFGLETEKTRSVLERLGAAGCEGVDGKYLRTMLEREG